VIQSQYEHVPLCADTVTSKFAKGAEALQQGAQDGGNCIPIVMAHGQANAEVVSDGEPSLTCNHEAPIAFVQNQREEVREQDVSGALSAEPGTHQTTYIAFDPAQVTSKTNRSNLQPGDPVHTLHQGEPPMLVRMREGKEGGGKGPLVSEDQSLTLATSNDQVLAIHPHVVGRRANAGPQGKEYLSDGSAYTHDARGVSQSVANGMQVRRLTPEECEALQGFPRGHTNIPWRGKPAADGPRYKALGNSWAVPVVAWIGRRIELVRSRQ